jgi:hypothetical protein
LECCRGPELPFYSGGIRYYSDPICPCGAVAPPQSPRCIFGGATMTTRGMFRARVRQYFDRQIGMRASCNNGNAAKLHKSWCYWLFWTVRRGKVWTRQKANPSCENHKTIGIRAPARTSRISLKPAVKNHRKIDLRAPAGPSRISNKPGRSLD